MTTTVQKGTNENGIPGETDVLVRKYGEAVINTLSSVASVLEYPKGATRKHVFIYMITLHIYLILSDFIKDSARPSYWVPDAEANNCKLCEMAFGTAEELDKSSLLLTPSNGSPSRDITYSPHKVMDRKRHHCRACGQAVCNSESLSPVSFYMYLLIVFSHF